MNTEETLLNWYFHVRDEGKILNPDEINWILNNAIKIYDEKLFSNGVFCLALGSNYFENHPEEIIRLLGWDLDDYDLGQLFDAIKYSNLTGRFIELLFSKISYEYFKEDSEYSVISALNTIAEYIYSSDEQLIYERFQNEFNRYVNGLDVMSLNESEIAFFNFFYKALLHAKHGKNSNRMTFDPQQIIRHYTNKES